MLKMDQVSITEEFGNQVAPYQIRIRHVASGVEVVGNTGSEINKPALRDSLLQTLEKCLPSAEATPAVSRDDEIAELKAMVAALLAGKQIEAPAKPVKIKTVVVEHKKRGRKPGTKMVGGKAVLPDGMKEGDPPTHPEGYSVLDPSKVSAPPMMAPPPARAYKPSQTVSRVSDKAAAKGFVA